MTNQELFDSVVNHLFRQGKRAMGPGGGSTLGPVCKYRAEDGSRCAIGALIPDDKYVPTFEGIGLSNTWGDQSDEILRAAGLDLTQRDLAASLQRVHDEHMPMFWAFELYRVADQYDLHMDVLDVLRFMTEEDQ